jgi:cytoskeletal protein RodZ
VFEIGNSLREARVRQHLELTEIELATKIRTRYLRALEEENFEALPAQTYVKGFLRTYADYLGLDGQLYVDEFNSRYGVDGEEPREPVMVRRTTVRRQHRRVERRWVIFALAGIGALFAFTIAAWKFSGPDNEAIPNLGTTTQPKKVLKPASPTKPVKTAPVSFRLYVRAVHGNCWMDVRNWSSSGKSRYTGTVELGQDQRWVSRRLWINFGAPSNLAIVFTPRGFSRAA